MIIIILIYTYIGKKDKEGFLDLLLLFFCIDPWKRGLLYYYLLLYIAIMYTTITNDDAVVALWWLYLCQDS